MPEQTRAFQNRQPLKNVTVALVEDSATAIGATQAPPSRQPTRRGLPARHGVKQSIPKIPQPATQGVERRGIAQVVQIIKYVLEPQEEKRPWLEDASDLLQRSALIHVSEGVATDHPVERIAEKRQIVGRAKAKVN